jgi:hypothetical protein
MAAGALPNKILPGPFRTRPTLLIRNKILIVMKLNE